MQKAAQRIAAEQNGTFPSEFDAVLALPGIGRYTAGAICSIAFNQPTPILDGNVIRVLTRIFGIAENPKEKQTNARLWQLAEELVCRAKNAKGTKEKSSSLTSRPSRDTSFCSSLNQSLMELGALACTPRNPQCKICPAKKLCIAFKENRVEELPNLGKRETATARRFVAFVFERNGRFLVRQRPAGVVNAHLWEFPNAEVNRAKLDMPRIFKSQFGGVPETISPLCKVKYSITRYRITLEAYTASSNKVSPASGIWKTPVQMRRLAFTAAHKKLATAAAQSMMLGR